MLEEMRGGRSVGLGRSVLDSQGVRILWGLKEGGGLGRRKAGMGGDSWGMGWGGVGEQGTIMLR